VSRDLFRNFKINLSTKVLSSGFVMTFSVITLLSSHKSYASTQLAESWLRAQNEGNVDLGGRTKLFL
jgi:hypothetical protein